MSKGVYFPNEKDFIRLSKKGNLIPVYKELLADFETPVSAFCKLNKADYSFLFESVEGQEKIGRYSFLGSNPAMIIKVKGNKITTIEAKKKHEYETRGNPFDEIKRIMAGYKFVKTKGIPRFCGGLVGYLGYDMIRFIEDIPDTAKDNVKAPDAVLMLTDTILIFDHVSKNIKVISNIHVEDKRGAKAAYRRGIKKIDKIIAQLKKETVKRPGGLKKKHASKLTSNFTRKEFVNKVKKAKRYIRAGDIIQVVLSQRLKKKIKTDPFNIYRSLRYINPSPYMFYLKFGELKLVGSSPEIMVRLEDEEVTLRPIAGTRPRGKTDKEDKRLIKELLKDPKELAEHVMLVDLGRNDIGRVCKYGSVDVDELMTIEKYSHVSHIVSNCRGVLKKGKDMFDVVKAAFPAGTVTGAPKIRAMEIIDELERDKRGPYAGSVIYFSFSGNLDSCITIRTIMVKGKTAYVQAGAGIVADSKPAAEYQETLNKAKGMAKAIELAEEPGGLIS